MIVSRGADDTDTQPAVGPPVGGPPPRPRDHRLTDPSGHYRLVALRRHALANRMGRDGEVVLRGKLDGRGNGQGAVAMLVCAGER